MKKNIYFDFEFIEDGEIIIPISLGMCTDESCFYKEYEFPAQKASAWVRKNVFPYLEGNIGHGLKPYDVGNKILAWLESQKITEPKFWGHYPAYDWVCLCQHFGTMMDLPNGWPMKPSCTQEFSEYLNFPKHLRPPDSDEEHHALADANWIQTFHERMQEYETKQR